MFTRERIKSMLMVVLLIVAILLVWDSCEKSARLSAFHEQVSKFTLSEQKFITTIDEQGNQIAEQEQVILSQEDAIKHNLLEIDRMKHIKSQVRVVTKTKIDSILVPYTDTLVVENPCDFQSRNFSLVNPNYSIIGKTKIDGILIDSLSFDNSMSITIGDKRNGWFKKSTPIIKVDYDNPFVSTKSLNNVIIENPPKWYQKRGTWFGVGIGLGIVGGILIAK
jgi:hypothetical protein